MQPTYRVTCLIDGLTLLPVVLGPESAPWFCMACRNCWWAAELTEESRKQFRPSVVDFGYGAALISLRERVDTEFKEAILRGTSCREDQIEQIPLRGLQRMEIDKRVNPDFVKKYVIPEIARKGAA